MSQDDKIKQYFLSKYNISFNESEFLEVRQSLYFLGKAISRYVVLQEQKRNTKSLEGEIE